MTFASSGTSGLGGIVLSGTAGQATTFTSDAVLTANTALELGQNLYGTGRNLSLVGAGSLVVSGSLASDFGAVTMAGGGVLTVSGSNGGWLGGFTLASGSLRVGNDSALGGGSLVLNGGAISSVA